MKTRGRKHTYAEQCLMAQVAKEFGRRKNDTSARKAARELGVSLSSFYNYVAGTDLPRIEVLREAQRKWGIKWNLVDPAAVLRMKKVQSAKQLVFTFFDALRKQDVEISHVGTADASAQEEGVLHVTVSIRFPVSRESPGMQGLEKKRAARRAAQ